MAKELMPAIEAIGAGPEKPPHPGTEIGRRRLHDPMEVPGHEAERLHLPTPLRARLPDGFHKQAPIGLTPTHPVIKRPRILNSRLPRHTTDTPSGRGYVNSRV